MYGSKFNLPGECRKCRKTSGESTGVGVKCQECREMREMLGKCKGVCNVPAECRKMQGDSRGTYGRG